MFKKNWFKLAAAIIVSLAAGWVGSIFTMPAIPGWYASLAKPFFNPPAWVFGPVWTLLYILMGIALFLVWSQPQRGRKFQAAMAAFFCQLALNALWSLIFFGARNPGAALLEIIVLWLAIVWTFIQFKKIERRAAWLLVPYLAWVSFASILNGAIYFLNR